MKHRNPRDASKPTDPKMLARMLRAYDAGETLARSVDLSNPTPRPDGSRKVLMLIVESPQKSPRSAGSSE
jgi:hypothetical protein